MTFREQILELVYAHGGDSGTPEETIDVLENMVRIYIRDLTINISENASYKGSLDEEAVKFALRRDPWKMQQACMMFRTYKDVQKGSSFSLESSDKHCNHQT